MPKPMMHHTHKEADKDHAHGTVQSILRQRDSELPVFTPQFIAMESETKHWNTIANELSLLMTLISAILKELQSD
jgi:hypothetical protein